MKVVTDFSSSSRPMSVGRGRTPRSLFAAGGIGAWFDPADDTSVFADASGTQPANVEESVGHLSDKSGSGNPATQAIPDARPALGRVPVTGKRNILRHTENASSFTWAREGVTIDEQTGNEPAPLQGPERIWRVAETETTAGHRVRATSLTIAAGQTYSASIFAKAGTYDRLSVVFFASGSAWSGGGSFDLTQGQVLSGGANASITAVGNGWYRCAIRTTAASDNATAQVIWGLASVGAYQGNPSNNIFLTGRMLEHGADVTPYQRVRSEVDVSEAGQRTSWFLFDDQIDDSLTWHAVAGVYTVAYAREGGDVVIAENQLLSGPTDVLQSQSIAGYVAINRALTQLEKNCLTAYLQKKGAGL